MRTFIPAALGLALAVSALGVTSASATEVQTGLSSTVKSEVTNVEYSPRCFRWRHYCRGLYPARGWRFDRCLLIHACRY